MINILLSYYDFGEGELYTKIRKYIKKEMKVVIIPFSHTDKSMPSISEYDKYCNKGGEYYELIANQFLKFNLEYSNIDLLHYYNDSIDSMKNKISQADIIFFTGGNPEKSIERIIKKDLISDIESFSGIIMGASAGALIQLSEYFCTPDENYSDFNYYQGLGLLSCDFYIEVHYCGESLTDKYKTLKSSNRKIYALPDGAGLICENDLIEVCGNVTLFDN